MRARIPLTSCDLAEAGDQDSRERLDQRRQERDALQADLRRFEADLRQAQGAGTQGDRQQLLASLRDLDGDELVQRRAQAQLAIREMCDMITFEPSGEATVTFLGGLLKYRFAADLQSVRCIDLRTHVAAATMNADLFTSGPDGKPMPQRIDRLERMMKPLRPPAKSWRRPV